MRYPDGEGIYPARKEMQHKETGKREASGAKKNLQVEEAPRFS